MKLSTFVGGVIQVMEHKVPLEYIFGVWHHQDLFVWGFL